MENMELAGAFGAADAAKEQDLRGYYQMAARVLADEVRRLKAQTKPLLLKGTGKINGDGWKDTTRVGQVVYAWNIEKPAPYAPGQFPRLGHESWTASTDQYDFEPVANAELPQLVNTVIEDLRAEAAELKRSQTLAPLTRKQIDDLMTQHYPLSSLLREEVDAFEECVRDLERLHGIGVLAAAPQPLTEP